MGGSLLSKTKVPGSSLLGHLPKEFSLRLTWCPWLVGYYDTRGISRGARKLARTPSLSNKKKKKVKDLDIFEGKSLTKEQNGDDMMRSRLSTITVSISYF